MILEVLFNYIPYALITNFTPGPNNILALNSTKTYGFKKSWKVLLGICSGFTVIMIACGIICVSLKSISDTYQSIMKYVGATYMFWLAWHIFISKPSDVSKSSPKELTFLYGFIVQFVNIKVLLYGMVSISTFILPYTQSIFIISLFICGMSTLGAIAALVWALAGSIFQTFLNKHYKIFNTIMTLILVENGFSIILMK